MEFNSIRRQKYLDETSYTNTLKNFEKNKFEYDQLLAQPNADTDEDVGVYQYRALELWAAFQLKYTAGENLEELSRSMGEIVEAFDVYVQKNEAVPEVDYYSPFLIDSSIDNYVDFINIVCAAILLHREDLLPVIFQWIDGGEFDGIDAVLEELLKFYFPDRPLPDSWIWDQPYEKLLDVIDSDSLQERPKLMKDYVKEWCLSMRKQASFCGKHSEIKPEFSPYYGYWAMCAAAFAYLLDIDDTLYRNEEVYPKDLVDYARSLPRRSLKLRDGTEILRVAGGRTCPHDGVWFSPAKPNSAQHFKAGDVMPKFDASEYGETIWQWLPE
jgi:hypothetical protein